MLDLWRRGTHAAGVFAVPDRPRSGQTGTGGLLEVPRIWSHTVRLPAEFKLRPVTAEGANGNRWAARRPTSGSVECRGPHCSGPIGNFSSRSGTDWKAVLFLAGGYRGDDDLCFGSSTWRRLCRGRRRYRGRWVPMDWL